MPEHTTMPACPGADDPADQVLDTEDVEEIPEDDQ